MDVNMAVVPVNTMDFLRADFPLTPVSDADRDETRDLTGETSETASHLPREDELERENPNESTPQGYEYDRYSFEEAMDILRPEYAAAVIVKSLEVEDLKTLTGLSFETGILVLHGEIILFTSGSEDEIGVLPAVREMAKKAVLVSHTHPSLYAAEGPSGHDVNEAAGLEYVITHKGAYAYSGEGALNGGNPYLYEWYLEQLDRAVEDSKQNGEKDSVEARKELNRFIAEQDKYNSEKESKKESFRMGGTLSYSPALTALNVTTLSGSPYPYLASGSSAGTSLSYNSAANQFLLGYNVTAAGSQSGLSVSFDNASTAAVETQNLTIFKNLVFGLKGPNSSVKVEIVDVSGRKDLFTLTGISNTAERFWSIPVASISNTLDKTKIRQINFIVTQANTTSVTRTGILSVRAKGLNVNNPGVPVITSSIPTFVNQTTFTLRGTKEANTAVLINGEQVVALNAATSWTLTVKLSTEGNNTFKIATKNSIGKVSPNATVLLKRDTLKPTGSININSGAAYAVSPSVTLNLSGTDAGSGMNTMSFSTDGKTWTAPAAYSATKSFTLPSGDGKKTVYVKYFDKAGNASAVYSKSIILDTAKPTGSININSGAAYAVSPSVTLNLSGTDAGSGMNTMSFSTDGKTWTAPAAYSATKSFTLPSGDGKKTVYVKYFDKAGNASAVYSKSIILDTAKPTGSININSGAAYAVSPSVT
ncbi:MAG TPA: Ig-like domain repeat protein, partial [Candidatus Omnitrophota bacterium]|nr:Ig-like domain repeat protein [Candidatus Omnitrophota bacterium]